MLIAAGESSSPCLYTRSFWCSNLQSLPGSLSFYQIYNSSLHIIIILTRPSMQCWLGRGLVRNIYEHMLPTTFSNSVWLKIFSGVTPYASILQSIMHRWSNNCCHSSIPSTLFQILGSQEHLPQVLIQMDKWPFQPGDDDYDNIYGTHHMGMGMLGELFMSKVSDNNVQLGFSHPHKCLSFLHGLVRWLNTVDLSC